MAARLLGPVSLVLCFAVSTAAAALLQPAGSLARHTSQGTLRLRGGDHEHTGAHGGSVEVMDDDNEKTAFAKITWKRNSGPLPSRKVEVVGSWSKFKARHELTVNPQSGDWEIIMELPMGEHMLKFVLDESSWQCNRLMERRADHHGNENNFIFVEKVIRSSRPMAPEHEHEAPQQQEEQAQLKKDLFVPATDSIDIAKDMVNRLEQEQKLAQEKLRKAHEQLVMTLKGELEQGVKTLQQGKKHVSDLTEKGNKGLISIREAGARKVTEVTNHMASIRSILDQKEAAAIAAIEDAQARRIEKLQKEIAQYNACAPDLTKLVDEASLSIKKSVAASSDNIASNSFVATAQDLIPKIEKASENAAQCPEPSIESNFDSIQLNLLPPSN